MHTARLTRRTCWTAWQLRTTSWRRPYVHALSSSDYALIRAVPNVERGACISVGALLLCRTQRFLKVRIRLDQPRVLALAPDLDLAAIQQELDAIVQVC